MKKQTKSVKKVLKSDSNVTKRHKTNTNTKQEPLAKVVNLPDLVYTLADKIDNDDIELKYSLRSVEQYAKDYSKIVIVGRLPEWINPEKVLHIPARDSSYKSANIKNKLLAAATHKQVSDNFIHMNDDYFLTQEWNFSQIEYFHSQQSFHDFIYNSDKRWNFYTLIVEQTWKLLKKLNLSERFYDLHIPFKFNKDKFITAMECVDWTDKQAGVKGYIIRSLYGNFHNLESGPRQDTKMYKFVNLDASIKLVKSMDMFSTSDNLGQHTHNILESLYPKKSEFEL